MTGQQFVDLMNDVMCLRQDARAAILTALREPTVERITAAMATTPHAGRFVDGLFDDDGVPVIDEASIWLAVRGGELDKPIAGLDTPSDVVDLSDEVRAEIETPPTQPESLKETPEGLKETPAKFRCVRAKRDGTLQNVTRPMSHAECEAYRTIKGDPKLQIMEA